MSTSTPLFTLPPDFFSKIQEAGEAMALDWLRVILKSTWAALSPFWPYILGACALIVIIAMVRFMLGETGPMGSLIYHVCYFGILGIILWVAGLQLIFNPFFDLLCAIIYFISYRATGYFLRKARYG